MSTPTKAERQKRARNLRDMAARDIEDAASMLTRIADSMRHGVCGADKVANVTRNLVNAVLLAAEADGLDAKDTP